MFKKFKISPFQKVNYSPTGNELTVNLDLNFAYYAFQFFVIVFFTIFLFRIFQLTVIRGNYFFTIAKDNQMKELVIPAPRGDILDLTGEKITIPYLESSSSDEAELAKNPYLASTHFLTNPNSLAHVIGYLNLPSQGELDSYRCRNPLTQNEYLGQSGIQKALDCLLRGKNGKKIVEVNASGKEFNTLDIIPPTKGQNVKLTISSLLQAKAYDLIVTNAVKSKDISDYSQYKISLIATIPKSGQVLTQLSYPSFDPNDFLKKNSQAISEYFADPNLPLFDRTLKGEYPPGSVYKTMIAAAGLEYNAVALNETIDDSGEIAVGEQKYRNWYFDKYGKTESGVNIIKALYRSNDTYFYRLGERLGSSKMASFARKFGYGNNVAMLLPNATGLVPSDFWKKETLGEPWYQGDNYNTSIGQGYVLTTPLQVHLANQVFANDGYYCPPRYVSEETDISSLPASEKSKIFPQCEKVEMASSTLDAVKLGMKATCETGGTAFPFFDFRISTRNNSLQENESSESASLQSSQRVNVGCKTGTAQSGEGKMPHSWFTAFAPFENPEIMITILVETSGEGSAVAAPLAKEVIKYYLESIQ